MRVVVVGLGAMGVAAARVLATRGHEVVGIDRHGVGSEVGSSAGSTRIFRLSHQDRAMVRLAVRALEDWRRLERAAGERYLVPRGSVDHGPPALAAAAALAAEGVAHEVLDAGSLARVFPELAQRPEPAVPQPDGATTLAAASLAGQARLARASGAELSEGERVHAVEPAAGGVRVATDRRTLEADACVVCAGPWAAELLAPLGLDLGLVPEIEQVTYFAGGGVVQRRPCLLDWPADGLSLYGMPVPGVGYKLGGFGGSLAAWAPEAFGWPVDREEEARLAAHVARRLPGLGRPLRSHRCPVTTTADGSFVLDRSGPVVVGAGCNGMAFKFSPTLGELLADIAEDRPRDPALDRFRLGRPGLRLPRRPIRDLFVQTEAPAGPG